MGESLAILACATARSCVTNGGSWMMCLSWIMYVPFVKSREIALTALCLTSGLWTPLKLKSDQQRCNRACWSVKTVKLSFHINALWSVRKGTLSPSRYGRITKTATQSRDNRVGFFCTAFQRLWMSSINIRLVWMYHASAFVVWQNRLGLFSHWRHPSCFHQSKVALDLATILTRT